MKSILEDCFRREFPDVANAMNAETPEDFFAMFTKDGELIPRRYFRHFFERKKIKDYLASVVELKEEWVRSQIDIVTGLSHRTFWYKSLNKIINELFPELKHFDRMSKEEKETALNLFSERAKEEKIFLISSDVSYLGWVNDKVSHSAGDELLNQIASVVLKQISFDFLIGRVGGDELVVLSVGHREEEVKRRTDMWRKKVSEITIVRGLQVNGVSFPPHIDVDYVSLEDAIECFRRIISVKKVSKGSFSKLMVNCFVGIADHRTKFVKYYGRLIKLARIRRESLDNYKAVIDHFRKGTNGATDDEICYLASFFDLVKDKVTGIETWCVNPDMVRDFEFKATELAAKSRVPSSGIVEDKVRFFGVSPYLFRGQKIPGFESSENS